MKKEIMKDRMDMFLLEEKYQEKSENTLIHYKHVIKMFLDSFDGSDLTKQDVINFKTMLMKRYKPRTVNNYIIVINKFIKFNEVVEQYGEFDLEEFKKHASKMIVKNVRVQQETALEDLLEPIEFKRLLRKSKELQQMDLYLIMKIFAFTGARAEELKYFTVENIESNYIEVKNKGKIRTIILRNDLKKELKKYCNQNNITEGYIFKGKKKDSMLHYTTIYKRLKTLAGQCRGIKKSKVHPHSFRHLFAIKFLEEGGDIGELADILGHTSINTTRIYIRTTLYTQRKHLERMKY